jgi:hypothetical protein
MYIYRMYLDNIAAIYFSCVVHREIYIITVEKKVQLFLFGCLYIW